MTKADDARTVPGGLQLTLRGSVQGVGFRPWVWRTARALGLSGSIQNRPDGVRITAFGSDEDLATLREYLAHPPLPGASVDEIAIVRLEGTGPEAFSIGMSHVEPDAVAAASVVPDLPTCDDCQADARRCDERRYRYPFVACASCGPRFSMTRALPYDRVRTSMRDFPLCPPCSAEYTDPTDRRFHAEATACPDCGPKLHCLVPAEITSGGALASTATGEAALQMGVAQLKSGGIVAVKGIGGFHLACDATDAAAVGRLRARKRRGRKPLAIMVGSVTDAEKHAVIGDHERRLLCDTERPIVLLRRRADSNLAPSVAPEQPMLGIMLAYTPLHSILLEDVGRPLVMTSANRSGDPIARRMADLDDGANVVGGGLADAILTHHREIVSPCDDSVVLPTTGAPIVLRRGRGHAPRPIQLARPVRHVVLALGGQWNDTICIASGDRAWMSAHIGDLESPGSVDRLEETAAHWLDLLGLVPDIIAHDLHPGYESTRLAHTFGGVPSVAVQHHHAHMAAVMAECGVEGPALGLIWDGTGHGGDGTAWGGELLRGDLESVERVATFRPIRLAGGERAIREPWRLSLALLDDAFGGQAPIDAIPLFGHIERRELEQVRSLIAHPDMSPEAHGVGRIFDAVGALLLMRRTATYQGELAQSLGFLCSERHAEAYDFHVDRSTTPWTIDLRPAVRALVHEHLEGDSPQRIADRFHATLVAAGDTVVCHSARDTSALNAPASSRRSAVILGGGCFQNRTLLEGLEARLGTRHFVSRPRRLPPGDGGLALGQAVVADARASAGEGD